MVALRIRRTNVRRAMLCWWVGDDSFRAGHAPSAASASITSWHVNADTSSSGEAAASSDDRYPVRNHGAGWIATADAVMCFGPGQRVSRFHACLQGIFQ